ncbi:unnamed protein product [Pleuronectes platessa]|uniref:Uncharacterized protein n=1 Tax=Pleuronectes platessa TaxID=8262 RepID=A0A9N7U900_PLEPL|nr:unnamed protein product [Pleuronectes platessa]
MSPPRSTGGWVHGDVRWWACSCGMPELSSNSPPGNSQAGSHSCKLPCSSCHGSQPGLEGASIMGPHQEVQVQWLLHLRVPSPCLVHKKTQEKHLTLIEVPKTVCVKKEGKRGLLSRCSDDLLRSEADKRGEAKASGRERAAEVCAS